MPAKPTGDTPAGVSFNFDSWEREVDVDPFVIVIGGKRYEAVDIFELDAREFMKTSDADIDAQLKMLFPRDYKSITPHKFKLGAWRDFSKAVLEHYGLGNTTASST